ncbi:MAG: DUF4221 domain-containing protein [Cyclobacteriaceae bacterium]|nr:DUF4221 domain-containing protein [Cyclobacteriaceae bacterium]MDW8331188.1 DUF4221 family protein [Cyclobacteriaceae bacterium]
MDRLHRRNVSCRLGGTPKHLHKFLLIIALFSLLVACKEKEITPECSDFTEGATLIVQDTISISIPSTGFPTYTQLFLYKDSLLYCLKLGTEKLDIYNIFQNAYVKSISLDPNFVQNLGAFFVHTTDSIFITQELTYVLLINDRGEIVDRYDLGHAPLSWTGSFDVPEYFFFAGSQAGLYYNSKRKDLVVTLTSPEIWYYENRSSFGLHGTYNILTKTWKCVFGLLPGVYARQNVAYPFILSNPYCLSIGDTSYVSFPMDHNLYVYNNQSGDLLKVVCGAARNFQIAEPFPYSELDDLERQRNFLMTNGWYGALQYHRGVKLFSRTLVRNSQDVNNERETAVIFFNQNLKRIGEYVFRKSGPFQGVGGDGYSVGFPTASGFYGSLKSKFHKSDDELRYSIKFLIRKSHEN